MFRFRLSVRSSGRRRNQKTMSRRPSSRNWFRDQRHLITDVLGCLDERLLAQIDEPCFRPVGDRARNLWATSQALTPAVITRADRSSGEADRLPFMAHKTDIQQCPLFGRYRRESGHGADSPFRSQMTHLRHRARPANRERISCPSIAVRATVSQAVEQKGQMQS